MATVKITVKDLARICGVSIGTIDRAINDRGGINPETKRRVLEAASRYGFVKNQSALSLSSGSTTLIGVIIFNLANEYFTTLLTAIEAAAHERGYSTLIMMSNYDADAEIDCVARLRAMNVAGIIVFSVLSNPAYYTGLRSEGVRVTAVGNRIDGIPFVGIDDAAAMYAGTNYVLSKGYERLIYVAPLLEKAERQNINAQSERYRGFLAAVGERGVPYETIGDYRAYETRLPSLTAAEKTALICPSDVYTLRCLALHGRRFGILGFDRLPMIGTLIPKLSAITYPTADIGRRAVETLLGGGEGALLPFELIPGDTI